jgi:hypothetical protein
MAKSDPRLPNGKRDNMKANPPVPAKQDPRDEKAKKKAKNDHELQVNKMNRLDALAKKSTAGKAAAPKPMPAPRGTGSGMGGKVAKGSKNPLRKLVSRVKRGR